MKYENEHYYEAPRIFWVVDYESKRNDKTDKYDYTAKEGDKYLKFQNLSVYAKWLYQTLKELEHRYTGKKNDSYTVVFEGVTSPKGWFYCGMEKLVFLSGISESSIRRARKELEKAGLLKMCKVRVLSKETGKFLWNSKGYRVFGETELRYSVTE